MPAPRPKTLEDFPHFIVSVVRRGESSANGYTRFDLDGRFDRSIDDIDPNWFWLLSADGVCLCASLLSMDKASRTAVLTCDEQVEPRVAGETLAYLSPYWQAYHVWMVLDPSWRWAKMQFHGTDAVAQDYDAKEVSVVDGREVRVWTKLEALDGGRGVSRHYPAMDQSLPPNPEPRIVPGGWGHEHCELCRTHINADEFGYRDRGAHWMCERCYERYVMRRDLAFVDEL